MWYTWLRINYYSKNVYEWTQYIYFIIYRLSFDSENESADEYLISTFITSNTNIGKVWDICPFEGIALMLSNWKCDWDHLQKNSVWIFLFSKVGTWPKYDIH